MNFFFTVPIFLGVICAYVWPYYALEINSFTIYILAIMSFVAFAKLNYSFSTFKKNISYESIYFLFIGFFVLPAIIWLFSYFIFENVSIRIGFFWAALSPVALFVPGFLGKKVKSEEQTHSFGILISSIFLFLISAFYMSQLFFKDHIDIPIRNYFIDTSIAILIPLSIVLILKQIAYFKNFFEKISNQVINLTNFWIVGLLTYIFLGTALLKMNYATLTHFELVKLIIVSILFDFILFGIIKLTSIGIKLKKFKKSYELSLSLRNVALAGGILLFYSPQSVLPIAGIFISHGLFLSLVSNDRK